MKTIRLRLKSKTTAQRADLIRRIVAVVFPGATTAGGYGAREVRFRVPENDTKHIWLLLLLKDARDILPARRTGWAP